MPLQVVCSSCEDGVTSVTAGLKERREDLKGSFDYKPSGDNLFTFFNFLMLLGSLGNQAGVARFTL
jgi:hypothetical protein